MASKRGVGKARAGKRANTDAFGEIAGTAIAVVSMDASLRVRHFTPAATGLFDLTSEVAAQRLQDVARRFDDDELIADAKSVLAGSIAREKDVRAANGRWWARRMLPSYGADGRVDGVTAVFLDITERKGAVDHAAIRLAAIVEHSADAIFDKDMEGIIRSWNKGAEKLYGYAADEVVGSSIRTIIPDDRADEWDRFTARLRRGEHVERFETERIRKDGVRIQVALTISPIRDDDGRMVSAAVIARDISERKRAERELEESRDRLRLFIANAPVALAMLDRELRYVAVSRQWMTDYDLADETLVGRSHYEVFPELPEEWRRVHRRGLAGEVVRAARERLVRADGSEQWIRWEVRPWYGQDSGVGGIIIFSEEITSAVLAEKDLHDTKERLRAILDTAVDSIITIDERGILQSVNRSTERMFGYPAGEMIGRNVSMLMPAPYHQEHDEYLAHYARTGEKRIIGIGREVEARRKDGTTFPIDLAVSEVIPGKLFTGMIRDISERKHSEVQLRHADRLASIGTLAAGLGHDMHNVLLPVRAHLNALRAPKKPSLVLAEGRGHVDEVAKSVSYLQQLADGLHFLAMDPDLDEDSRGGGDTTDLRQWWSQAGVLISKGVPEHVRVTASIPEGLPRVSVAAHSLTQAVLNLVVNAGDAIPSPKERKRRQGHVRVWARSDAAEGVVRLGVTDNGRGMTDEVKRRAFEMFFTTKVRGLGTGLGLALVQRVAVGAGGRLEVESEVGKGTTLMMVLKAVGADADAEQNKPVAVISVHDGRAGALARHILESGGMRVSERSDPDGADVWFVDPGESALRKAKAWRAKHPQGQLVLSGVPGKDLARSWERLQPIVVQRLGDFESLRSALAKAIPARSSG